jgi:hypothetical protein
MQGGASSAALAVLFIAPVQTGESNPFAMPLSADDKRGAVIDENDWSGLSLTRILLFEELHHELLLNLIQLPECRLQSRPVVIGSFAEDVFEANGGAPHKQFHIFLAFCCRRQRRYGFFCIPLHELERF